MRVSAIRLMTRHEFLCDLWRCGEAKKPALKTVVGQWRYFLRLLGDSWSPEVKSRLELGFLRGTVLGLVVTRASAMSMISARSRNVGWV
jgi:hypothetical protein